MRTYIVRIYRQEPEKPEEIIGDIEEAGVDGKKIFHTFEDLEKILKATSLSRFSSSQRRNK